MKNIWLLTEERPRRSTIKTILEEIEKDFLEYSVEILDEEIKVVPIYKDGNFTFTYKVVGVKIRDIDSIFVENVRGKSSFADYVVFIQEHRPDQQSEPIYIIEETKTDESESRNTGTFQRATKFIYAKSKYPNAKLRMLYSLSVEEKNNLTATYKFGLRCFATLDVRIIGKRERPNDYIPFVNIDDLISVKNSMRKPPAGNVPITIQKVNESKIEITGRLEKNGSLSHDPNIGALTLISATLRSLGWGGEIEITKHGLPDGYTIKNRNKFARVANTHQITVKNIEVPEATEVPYWEYSTTCAEKVVTIYLHVLLENYLSMTQHENVTIFDNHAGCEKSYFIKQDGQVEPVAKYSNREKYKNSPRANRKEFTICLPDLVVNVENYKQVLNIEGEVDKNYEKGLLQLETFGNFESEYINKYYKGKPLVRGIVISGSRRITEPHNYLFMQLHKNGRVQLFGETPKVIKEAYEYSVVDN